MSAPLLMPDDSSIQPTLLLELTVAGVVYRFAQLGPLDIASDDGPLHFGAGLDISDIEDAIDLWGTSTSARSIAAVVYLDGSTDLETLLGTGEELYAASACVRRWAGGVYETAQVIAAGMLVDPIYGEPGQPAALAFSIDRDATDRALVPEVGGYVREDSFAGLGAGAVDENAVGTYYPVIIGAPGLSPDVLSGVRKVAPVVRANLFSATPGLSRLVVAGHSVQATGLKVWASNNLSGTCDLLEDTDDYGRLVTYLDLTSITGGATASDILNNPPNFVAWAAEGLAGPEGAGLHLLGDVVVWALEQTSLAASGGIDWRRVHGLRGALNLLGRVDTWISERVSPLDWLVSEVLAHFPVYIADSGRGLYVGIWRYDAQPSDAVDVIDVSAPGYARISPVAWTSGDVANEITIGGQYSAASGGLCKAILWSGDPAVYGADTSVRTHPLLQRSWSLFGRRELTVEAATIQDTATLDRIGAWAAARYALPRAEVGYRVPWRKVALDLGDVVLVRDPGAGLSERLGLVTGRRYSGEQQVRVSILPRT